MSSLSRALLALAFIASLASCKKEEAADLIPDPGAAPTISDFSHLAVGNYWVYEIVDLDSLGNDVYTWPTLWRAEVTGDSIIDGISYARVSYFMGQTPDGVQHQRIDGDKLVSEYEVLFQFGQFGTIIRTDTTAGVLYADYIVDATPVALSVPAGTFASFAMVGHVTTIGPYQVPEERYPTYHWAAGVGLVRFRSFDPSTALGRDIRLVEYSAQ
ncbi:MAG: hypothetical protein KA175_15710 [Flavobacteriales bacterium]|nr:hypothetical protein [Flavobacteriales bacterium]MBP6699067.1 hypothetical protein [Flavobacteriales bacterium]